MFRLLLAGASSVFSHPGNFLRRTGIWILAFVLLHGAAELWLPKHQYGLGIQALNLLLAFVSTAFVAANWHRGLLLGEPPTKPAELRLTPRFWRLLGISVSIGLIGIIAFLPLLLIKMIIVASANAANGAKGQFALFAVDYSGYFFIALATACVMARLGLAYPLTALDAKGPTLLGSLEMTRDHSWRLAAIFLLANLGMHLAGIALDEVLKEIGGDVLVTLAGKLLDPVFFLLSVCLIASLASYSFAMLTGHPLAEELKS